MPNHPDDDDPSRDWGADAKTISDDTAVVTLDASDIEEISREESTPTVIPTTSPLDFERGRRVGARDERDRVLKKVGEILGKSHSVSARQVAEFLDLVRTSLNHPAGR